MLTTLADQVPGLLTGATLVGIVAAVTQLLGRRYAADRTVAAQLEEHRDRLALDLLHTAREERTAMREEIERLKALAARLDEFDLAIAHIEALLTAGDADHRRAIERSARQFLDRIRSRREASHPFRGNSDTGVEARLATAGGAL